ncbi:GcrA family cell cycle regulator [Methylobacterium brachiatum]
MCSLEKAMDWTEDRIEAFGRLWDDGLSTRMIAAALGITKNAVVGKAYRLGFARRRPSNRPGSAPRPEGAKRVVSKAPEHPILALTPDTCHWPLGDPKTKDFRFCLGAVERGRSYCATHAAQSSRGRERVGRNDVRPTAG